MKRFLNDPDDAVDEALAGFLTVHGADVRRLDTARVVVRRELVPNKVGLVSGGGSGHKPAFVGYVGDGLLDAAAVGDIFTSPTTATAVEAIRAADSGAGVLFLLGNYAGDVMNFTAAAEQARAAGHRVELVIVNDDIGAGEHVDPTIRRGVAGSVLVWKVAGALARAGGTLEAVRDTAQAVNAGTRTTGIALTACVVPGATRSTFAIGDDEMEIGVGLHGDRGVATVPLRRVDEVVDESTDQLLAALSVDRGDRVVTMVNGFGATPLLELYVAQRRLATVLEERGITLHRAYVGEFITCLEQAGMSLSILRVTEEVASLVDAPARAPHFVQC